VTWPNRITYSRIVLIPLFAVAALEVRSHEAYKYVAVGIFCAIAVGDLLDGYVAKRFKLTSLEGKFIDPLADKLLMITACVFLALPLWGMKAGGAPLAPEIAVVIVARDVLICMWVVVGYLAGARIAYEASRLGRLTTFFQMLMLGTMLGGTLSQGLYTFAARPLSYVAAGFTIASGLHYFFKYAKYINLRGAGGGQGGG